MRASDLLPQHNLVHNTLNFFTKLRCNICWFTFTYYAGFVSDTFVPDSGGFNLEDLDNFTSLSPAEQGDPDVLGSSQLGGVPLGISQQHTPQPLLRPERHVRSPDHHTYSQDHVHAQQRAKRVRQHRGGQMYPIFVFLMFICTEIAPMLTFYCYQLLFMLTHLFSLVFSITYELPTLNARIYSQLYEQIV